MTIGLHSCFKNHDEMELYEKKFLIILLGCLFLTGCGSNSEKNVLKKFD